jgi:hypothetical protein
MNSMCDANIGGTPRSRLQTIFNGPWFSGGSGPLVGRRVDLPALLGAALVNLILFGLFLACATPVYETNDDLMMQLIVSGFYTGHPDAHLVFTNISIGWVLRFFYGTWAGCNWYLIYLLVVHYLALTAIAFLVMARRGGWLSAWLYVFFFLVVETHILLHLQFTTTAFLAGTAGLLLLVDGLRPGYPAHWPEVIGGVALVGLMGLVREPVALLLAVIASPFLLERFGWAGWRRLLATGLACAGIVLVLHEVNRWAYQRDPAWAEYSEYNRLRGEIHDTPLEKFIPEADSAVGWSQNDGWMFSQYYFSDLDVYAGVPRLRLLLTRLKALARDEPAILWRFPAGDLYLPKLLGGDAGILMKLAMLNAIGCLLVAGASRQRWLVTLLISYGLFVGLSVYLLTTARLPERVSYNLPLFMLAICLYWATGFRNRTVAATSPDVSASPVPRWRAQAGRRLALVLVPVWAVLCLFCLAQLADSLRTANAKDRDLEQVSHKILGPIRTLLPGPQTPTLIALPFDSVLERCLFFYPATEKIPFSLVPYGWITQSPLYNRILQQHQLRPYSLSLVKRPDVFFLMGTRWLEPLRTFYREHYGLNIRFDTVLNTDETPLFEDCQLHLYQAHIIGEPAPAGTAPR